MSFTIRPFADRDYPALCVIIKDVFDQLFTPESLRDEEARRDPKCRHEAWVAEVDGQVVAFAEFNQWVGAYHPRKFGVMVAVLPDYRRRGIGGALYNQLREALAPTDPIALSSDAKESRPDSIGFLERRGFAEKMRSWESRLDLTTFDPGAFADTVDAAGARGYEFLPLTAVRDLPDYARQIYEMLSVARRDVPTLQPMTEIPFEQWVKSLSRPHLFPEGYWIAFKDGQMVGISTIWTTDDAGMLETGITAVLREHRGASVAKALKIKALSAAKAHGIRRSRPGTPPPTVPCWRLTAGSASPGSRPGSPSCSNCTRKSNELNPHVCRGGSYFLYAEAWARIRLARSAWRCSMSSTSRISRNVAARIIPCAARLQYIPVIY